MKSLMYLGRDGKEIEDRCPSHNESLLPVSLNVTHIPGAIQRQSLPQEPLVLIPPMSGAESDPSPVNALKLGGRKKP